MAVVLVGLVILGACVAGIVVIHRLPDPPPWKYRIVERAGLYRVQRSRDGEYWEFVRGSGGTRQWGREEAAREWVELERRADEIAVMPWVPVDVPRSAPPPPPPPPKK